MVDIPSVFSCPKYPYAQEHTRPNTRERLRELTEPRIRCLYLSSYRLIHTSNTVFSKIPIGAIGLQMPVVEEKEVTMTADCWTRTFAIAHSSLNIEARATESLGMTLKG